jgi:hypothetical protein
VQFASDTNKHRRTPDTFGQPVKEFEEILRLFLDNIGRYHFLIGKPPKLRHFFTTSDFIH